MTETGAQRKASAPRGLLDSANICCIWTWSLKHLLCFDPFLLFLGRNAGSGDAVLYMHPSERQGQEKKKNHPGLCCEQDAEVWSCSVEFLGRKRAGGRRQYLSGSAVTLPVAVYVPRSFVAAQSDSTMARGEMQRWQRTWAALIDLVLGGEGEGSMSSAGELFEGWEIPGHSTLDKSQRLRSVNLTVA